MTKLKTPSAKEAPLKPLPYSGVKGLARIAKHSRSATVTEIAEAEGIGRTLALREAN